MATRRQQGLCYNCDEPYVRSHKCARLFYLEVTDYVTEDAGDNTPPEAPAAPAAPAAAPAAPDFDPDAPMISLWAITGIRSEETMQLRIRIGEQHFTTLLDSGSTHNFISMQAAHRAGLCVATSQGAHVVVADVDEAGALHAVVESARVTPELVRLVVGVDGVGTVDAVAPLGGRVAPGDEVSLRVDVTRLAVLPITGVVAPSLD